MNNKKEQEKLCTEPREPEQALVFAIAFEKGVKKQKSYSMLAAEPSKCVVKSEPVYAVEKTQLTPSNASDVGNQTSAGTHKELRSHHQ